MVLCHATPPESFLAAHVPPHSQTHGIAANKHVRTNAPQNDIKNGTSTAETCKNASIIGSKSRPGPKVLLLRGAAWPLPGSVTREIGTGDRVGGTKRDEEAQY
eukprot:1128734-Rhodomonas_salina.2